MPRNTNNNARNARRMPPAPAIEAYPRTVAECLEDRTYKPAVIRAMRAFKRSKPWRGSLAQRFEKYKALNEALAAAYNIRTPALVMGRIDGGGSGSSSYCHGTHTITLRGKLSVVTYLHEFGHARGYGERGTCRWSTNLFRRIFPRLFARMHRAGHTLLAPSDPAGMPRRIARRPRRIVQNLD